MESVVLIGILNPLRFVLDVYSLFLSLNIISSTTHTKTLVKLI